MDTENLNRWSSQPDVCRCCLSSSGTWDLTASYITDGGQKEVYSEILEECYGITLSYLSEWGPSRMVCGLCVGHLRDACSFRKQVLQAERHFVNHWNVKKDEQTMIDNECTPHSPGGISDDIAQLGNVDDERKDTIKIQSNTHTVETMTNSMKTEKEHTVSGKKRRKTGVKLKRKRRKIKVVDQYDSDTPIAELSKKNVPSEFVHKVENTDNVDNCEFKENEIDNAGDKVEVSNRGQQQMVRMKNCVKQVSERKRVMLTCDTVLSHTTACPFRHHKSWFQCFFCYQDFMEINQLREHTLRTHPDIESELKKIKRFPRSLQIDISNLECRHCNLNLIDVEAMRRHFGDVHNKVIYNECIADYKVDVSPYTCHICKQEFHVFRTLTTHLNEHYANCICDVCGKSFLNSKRLKVHKRTHEDGQFPCSECGKILKTKTSKANHMESAHSRRIIKCQICFKPMKHYNDRIKHMSEVHNITHKFKCPICGREYNIKHYLATHIRQTHGHKNKKCTECGMAFITNHGLKKHMLKHTGEKPFTCSVCCKSYARNYTLREHMRGHQNDRRFLCAE